MRRVNANMTDISARNPTKQFLVSFHNQTAALHKMLWRDKQLQKTKWVRRAARRNTLTNVREVSVRMLVAKKNTERDERITLI